MAEGKTLILFGSPKKSSFTAELLEQYLKKNGTSDFILFDCFKNYPIPCDDCGFCKENFSCSKPDLKVFFEEFEHCDRVVLAFPVYNNSVPAPLKALLDRMQIYYHARFTRGVETVKKLRSAALLMTSGSSRDVTDLILAQLKPVLKLTNCRLELCCLKTSTDSTADGTTFEHTF